MSGFFVASAAGDMATMLALATDDFNSELPAVFPTAVSAQAIHPPTPLLDQEKYSSLFRLLRVTAWISRNGLEKYFQIAFRNCQQVHCATQRLCPREASDHAVVPGGC
ncbi:hypothetical protein MRX96_015773 [Rhipicephalus microplus]